MLNKTYLTFDGETFEPLTGADERQLKRNASLRVTALHPDRTAFIVRRLSQDLGLEVHEILFYRGPLDAAWKVEKAGKFVSSFQSSVYAIDLITGASEPR